MWKKSKVTDQTAAGQAGAEGIAQKKKGIKRKSKVPGVMITQYVEELPEGKSTPDFTRKPIALTIQEGKLAIFKAKVMGDPTPKVTWNRANGEMNDPEKFQVKYDETSGEHTLEIPKVSPDEADTYKCFATNEYGKAVCTVILNIIEVGFKSKKEKKKTEVSKDPNELRKMLKRREPGPREEKAMESEEKIWEILLSADKKDYESICAEFGITNFRWMLKKLNEMKKEREEAQAEFIEHISNLKPIQVKGENEASFEIEMELKDPNSRIFLYKDGVMVPFTEELESEMKHCLKQVGKKYIFSVKNLRPEDAGLYQVDVEGVNIFSTDFKIPPVDFIVKLEEVKAEERQDALFQCVLSQPMNAISWFGKSAPLENDDKFEMSVSEDKLIHKLLVKDCLPVDTGIYAAVAGIKSCNAWLVVEADKNPATKGKKKERKTTLAGGGGLDLEKIALEQQAKLKRELEAQVEAAKKAQAEREAAEAAAGGLNPGQAGKGQGNPGHGEAGGNPGHGAAGKAAGGNPGQGAAGGNPGHGAAGKAAGGNPGQGAAGGNPGQGAAGGNPGQGAAGGNPGQGAAGGNPGQGAAGGNPGQGAAGGNPGHGAAGKAAGGNPGQKAAGGNPGQGAAGGHPGQGAAGGNPGHGAAGGNPGNGAAGKAAGGNPGQGAVGGNPGHGAAGGNPGHGAAGGNPGNGAAGSDVTGSNPAGSEATAGAGTGVQVNGAEGEYEFEDEGDEACAAAGGPGVTSADGAGAEGDGTPVEKKKRVRKGPILHETVVDPGVHFTCGLSDVNAIMGEAAELTCKVSREDCKGVWYKDGQEITSKEGITTTKDGVNHKLTINKVTEEFAGTYRFEADGRKTEAVILVEDPPRFDPKELETFEVPVVVKTGKHASFKISHVGRDPTKVQWYKEGEELSEESNIKIERSEGYTRLLLNKLHRKDSGEIKIKLKNEFGTTEAFSQLVVLDKPTPPIGPLEILEATSSAIEIKWRQPKDNGGCPVTNYVLERQQVGRNTWTKLGQIPGEPTYKDTNVDHGRRYCYRIRAVTAEGVSEMMETEDVQAGTKAYPGPPSAPKVVSAFKNCINLAWSSPANTGGTSIVGYNMEKRKKGSNLWSQVNPADEPIREKHYGVKEVIDGMQYEFRVSAVNSSGPGEPSAPSEFVFARDPKKPPGKVVDLKVTDSTYNTLSLGWTKPKVVEGVEDEVKGYFVEIRPAEDPEWERCNTNKITSNFYTVKGLKSMAMYWVRVIATNDGGEGEPQELDNYILAMPPPVRPRFTDAKIQSFMVVRAGNSARVNINFEASPMPEIIWLKDGMPVSKRVTISNAEETSQILIPSAERSDTGLYTIIVKNIVGQETFSVEIRVTDEPKPPGPVEMDENVPGTVTVSWTPSPDEKRDDRLHYLVSKRDSNKRVWHTVGDHIFNNKFTVCNILPGREYQFRIYAKNDMGLSEPSESQKWAITVKKEKFTVNMPESRTCNLERPPKFLVPLKQHTAPQGYECYMSCAVRGDPTPHVTWYRNNISLNTNTNYYISNTCGVCSMLILRVGPKDTGEYKVIADSALGRAECSTQLTVRE